MKAQCVPTSVTQNVTYSSGGATADDDSPAGGNSGMSEGFQIACVSYVAEYIQAGEAFVHYMNDALSKEVLCPCCGLYLLYSSDKHVKEHFSPQPIDAAIQAVCQGQEWQWQHVRVEGSNW